VVRFKQNNYGSKEYDHLGKLKYAGWVFNGFDTRSNKMLRADQAHYENIAKANERLATDLVKNITDHDPVVHRSSGDYNIGNVEDMNILIQNSLWQNVPVSKLDKFRQVQDLTGNKQKWSDSQLTLIGKVRDQIHTMAARMIAEL
jgi:hypothetical protein